MKILAASWEAVTKGTVINCFKKTEPPLTFNKLSLLIQTIHLKFFKKI